MPSIQLRWDTSNTSPGSSNATQTQTFSVDFVNDRELEVVNEEVVLLSKKIFETSLGVRRKLRFSIRPADVVANKDFLVSFFNASYRWALINDAGYYFNAGRYASKVEVPVVLDDDKQRVTVQSLIEDGLSLKSSDIYPIPLVVPGTIEAFDDASDSDIYWSSIANVLAVKIYKLSGGNYVYQNTVNNADHYLFPLGMSQTFKFIIVTMGGESPLSGAVTSS